MKTPDITSWSPSKIIMVEKSISGAGTHPFEVLTDTGRGVIKVPGNPQGTDSLISEFLGTSLAKAIGLQTFPFSLLNLSAGAFQFSRGSDSKPGHGFISKFEKGIVWDGSSRVFERLINFEDITKLLVLDTWVCNFDRYSSDIGGKEHRNYDNVFFKHQSSDRLQLIAMDFSFALTRSTLLDVLVDDTHIYGNFPEFKPYFNDSVCSICLKTIKNFSRISLETIINKMPVDWNIDQGLKDKVVEFLEERAAFLASRPTEIFKPE
ncbi:hypothetical protein K8I28_11310 [bacterium]|nr:hypothetical protein [bacterium]